MMRAASSAHHCTNVDSIIALRKFVRSETRRVRPTPGTILARLRLIPGSVASSFPPKPLCAEVTAATKSGIDHYEDQAVCGSPRSEASPSAFCSWRDSHYADCEFDFDGWN